MITVFHFTYYMSKLIILLIFLRLETLFSIKNFYGVCIFLRQLFCLFRYRSTSFSAQNFMFEFGIWWSAKWYAYLSSMLCLMMNFLHTHMLKKQTVRHFIDKALKLKKKLHEGKILKKHNNLNKFMNKHKMKTIKNDKTRKQWHRINNGRIKNCLNNSKIIW